MRRADGESGDAERPTQEAQITLARIPDGSRALTRQSTDVLPSVAEDLKFVNISHPEDIRQQKEVRTEIRRHVMKGIGQQRRRPRPKKFSQAGRTLSLEVGGREISQVRGADINSVPPSRSLGTLGSFPVEANKRDLELIHFGKGFILSPQVLVHSFH